LSRNPDEQIINDQVDRNLINLVLAGDHRAFESLVRRYQKLVYNVLLQMVQSRDCAADLTQETFLKSFRSLSTFNPELRFKPWLMRIATNTGLNSLRDEKPHDSLDEIIESDPQFDLMAAENVEQQVELALTTQELKVALSALPVRQRTIFILRYQYDFPYDEIAVITNESIPAIKSVLFRTRERLRKQLFKTNGTEPKKIVERGIE
jgi:RNA polymerase sigma-70 factor (ECF subfamily)